VKGKRSARRFFRNATSEQSTPHISRVAAITDIRCQVYGGFDKEKLRRAD
jgi:hypothetical protein